MIPHQTKQGKLPGTNYAEVYRAARVAYRDFERRTRRKPYVRSAYFKKKKVFFGPFWQHLHEKRPQDRMRRLKYFATAIELIQHSRQQPESKANPNKPNERLHRFFGRTREGNLFYVQIKENLRSGRKDFISCFPWE